MLHRTSHQLTREVCTNRQEVIWLCWLQFVGSRGTTFTLLQCLSFIACLEWQLLQHTLLLRSRFQVLSRFSLAPQPSGSGLCPVCKSRVSLLRDISVVHSQIGKENRAEDCAGRSTAVVRSCSHLVSPANVPTANNSLCCTVNTMESERSSNSGFQSLPRSNHILQRYALHHPRIAPLSLISICPTACHRRQNWQSMLPPKSKR